MSNSELFFRGKIKKLLHHDKFHQMEKGLHIVTLETAFVVRTFFFVIFGASIVLSSLANLDVVYISLAILASIYLVRWIFLRIFLGKDLTPQLWIAPRGLITVLLFYAIQPKTRTRILMLEFSCLSSLQTGVVMTVGLIMNSKKASKAIEGAANDTFEFDEIPVPQQLADLDSNEAQE